MTTTYPWKRFWCQRTGNFSLGQSGYLYDPDTEYGSIYNPDVKSFSEIEKCPVLGLLGEPGIGKSFAVEQLVEKTRRDMAVINGHVLYLNLNAIGNEDRLERKIFGSDEFKRWERDKTPLHIYFDSFDECLLSITTLSRFFSEEFKTYPTDNLFIRIACRTHDWPIGLEQFLSDHWGEDNFGVYELTPLRQVDVIEAAKLNELDTEKFLEEISSCNVESFAIKPITLQMLVTIFKKDKGFPAGKLALYEKGCLSLAEESNTSRQDAKHFGTLDPKQRLVVASRIAALTVFGGKNAIWTGPLNEEISSEDLTFPDMSGGYEVIEGTKVEIGESTLREVIRDTGFFSSRGAHRAGWAHQSYAEYLAAYYLISHNVSFEQSLSLLCHPEDGEKKLIPQLTEVASWLASRDDEVFSHIVKVEPETLLKGDFGTFGETTKENLTSALLAIYESGDAVDNVWDQYKYYSKLSHSGLADQLQPYISDSCKGKVVRRFAIDIAEACNLMELQTELLTTALNEEEDCHIRCQAIHAICLVGDEQAKLSLKPLVFGMAGADLDDQLKGNVFKVLWPNYISAEELFSHLTLPQNEKLIGAYDGFLTRDLVENLNAGHIVIALEWLATDYSEWGNGYRKREIGKKIFGKAWEFIDTEEISNSFLRVILQLSKKDCFQSLEGLIASDEKNKRTLLLDALLANFDENKLDVWICSRINLINTDDIPCLIERSEGETDHVRQYLAELAEWVFDSKYTDIVLILCEKDIVFAEVFKKMREPVLLDSPEADRLRRIHFNRNHNCEKISPSPMEDILDNLVDSESGNVDIWPSMLIKMSLDEYGEGGWPRSDYQELCGWKAAGKETQKRITAATKAYLLHGTPKTETLFEKSTKLVALASDYALRLLYVEDREFVYSLDNGYLGKVGKGCFGQFL